MSAYPPLEEYAFLSDCGTAALVGPDGAVEWMCAPRFDGPSHFTRILDRGRGGAAELHVEGAGPPERRYLDRTLVLESRWESPHGTVVAHDLLALAPDEGDPEHPVQPAGVLVRLVTCTAGTARVTARVDARPDHGRSTATWRADGDALVAGGTTLRVGGVPAPRPDDDGTVVVSATLAAGESTVLALTYRDDARPPVDVAAAEELRDRTVAAWRRWSGRSDYAGIGAAAVHHSALVLRGLLADETGALLAAPTTSLPEWIGGPRNWDYRYAWHRDAGLTVLVLMRLGHVEEAGRYLRFVLCGCRGREDRLEPMLDIDGGVGGEEIELDHLEGYAGSAPVRVGNEAFHQHQLDAYGHILDAAFAYQEVAGDLDDDDLDELRRIVDALCARWREPDHGLWEARDSPRRWTYSMLMAWVALDRGVRLAGLTDGRAGLGEAAPAWAREREAVRDELLSAGTHPDTGAIVQSVGAANMDAALLQAPLVGFLPGDDPHVLATIDAVADELGEAGFLVHRYDPVATDDGLNTPEGAFLLSSFEMVSALVLAGRVEEARDRFDALLAHDGAFGLYSEEMTTTSDEARAAGAPRMLGNHPQAFTHLGLIAAALNLDAAARSTAAGADALHDWADAADGARDGR